MKQYPLIEGLKLEIIKAHKITDCALPEDGIILASDLEKLLSEGVKVKGNKMKKDNFPDNWAFDSKFEDDTTTHTALLINLKPIEKPKPVSKEELLKTLKDPMFRDNTSKWNELISRIESQGVE